MKLLLIFLIEFLNVVTFVVGFNAEWLSSFLTLLLAGAGGALLAGHSSSIWSWPLFALAYSLALLLYAFAANVLLEYPRLMFYGYFVSWVLLGLPSVFLATWTGCLIGTRIRRIRP